MAKKLYEESNISAIASAIRSKNGLSDTYTVSDMASAILSIETDPVLESLNVSVNGSYAPGAGVDGFSQVVVSVPGSAGILISKTISENGTYDALDDYADGFSQVVVSVPTGGSSYDERMDARAEGRGYSVTLQSASIIVGAVFAYDTAIESIRAEQCLRITQSAFRYCTNLKRIEAPHCSIIESYAFLSCTHLETISFPECTYIDNNAFQSAGISSVRFPACTSVGMSPFISCRSISVIVHSEIFPLISSLTETFYLISTNTLKSIYAETVTHLKGSFIFCDNIGLNYISIPYIDIVASAAFLRCRSLPELTLRSCSIIYSRAFEDCSSFTALYLLTSSVVTLAASFGNIFKNTPMLRTTNYGLIYVPESLVDSYKSAQYWSNYSDRITAYVEI